MNLSALAPPCPRPRARLGLQVRYVWGDQSLAVTHHPEPRPVHVGEGAADFPLAAGQIGGRSRLPIARPLAGGFALCFDPRAEGVIECGGDAGAPLSTLARSATESPDGLLLFPLEPGDCARIDLGGVRAELSYAPTPQPAATSFGAGLDTRFANLAVFVLVAAGALAIAALNTPFNADTTADDLLRTPPKWKAIVRQAPGDPPSPRIVRIVALRRRTQDTAPSPSPRGPAGRTGAPERPARTSAFRIDLRGPPQGSLAVLAGRSGPGLAGVFAAGLGNDLTAALDRLAGIAAPAGQGTGGLADRGPGPGGGSSGFTVGLDRVQTRGRAGGSDAYGSPADAPGAKSSPDPEPTVDEPVVCGSADVPCMDRALLRQVIHRRRAQIRYCYETRLAQVPDLAGKLSVRFTIGPEGAVAAASSAGSTLGDDAVAHCVLSRIRSWVFPRPRAGGVVEVVYPFVFKSAGD